MRILTLKQAAKLKESWEKNFDKEFEVVTEVEFGHQHFQKLPTPDKFKSFINTLLERVIDEIPDFKNASITVAYLVPGTDVKVTDSLFKLKQELKKKYGIK